MLSLSSVCDAAAAPATAAAPGLTPPDVSVVDVVVETAAAVDVVAAVDGGGATVTVTVLETVESTVVATVTVGGGGAGVVTVRGGSGTVVVTIAGGCGTVVVTVTGLGGTIGLTGPFAVVDGIVVVSGLVETVGAVSVVPGGVVVGVARVGVTPVRVPIASPEPPPHAARATTNAASTSALGSLAISTYTGFSLPLATASLNAFAVSGPKRPSAVTPRSVCSFFTAAVVAAP